MPGSPTGCGGWRGCGKIAAELGLLRAREPVLRAAYDEPSRAGAEYRALLPEGSAGANFLRYARMHELTLHRAMGALLKGREKGGAGVIELGVEDEVTGSDIQ